jgi:putative oxidoreductase
MSIKSLMRGETPGPLKDLGLLLMRVGFAGTMALGHGLGKLTGFGERVSQFPDPLGLGSPLNLALPVFAEFFCGIAIVLGLLTRWATIPMIVTMAVAFFIFHGDDPFGDKELAFVYLVGFVAIWLTGPGRFSLDAWLGRRR